MTAPRYYVLLDSNVWISERLLQSALGAALLHAVTKDGGMIALPEIVEREVNGKLLEEAERQVGQAQKALQYLRQTSQRKIDAVIPERAIIERGVQERWGQLTGRIQRLDFTFDHAKAALVRILAKTPPCGKENEQFRDCCIWECALVLAADAPVHLVSNDYAFYQGGKRDAGMAQPLAKEAEGRKHSIALYPDLDGFLSSLGTAAAKVDDAALQALIIEAALPHAEAWAQKQRAHTSTRQSIAASQAMPHQTTRLSPSVFQRRSTPPGAMRAAGAFSMVA
jgi:hypothetical protein